MKNLNELFTVTYGNKLDLNKMDSRSLADGGVSFVGRSSQNNGVSGVVARLEDIEPYPAGLITVALGGTKILSSFVQEQPFYTAQNVAILSAKLPMTFAEKIYVCLCIRHNRFRYSAFGREANRTLRSLPIPEPSEFPSWVHETNTDAEVNVLDALKTLSTKAPTSAPAGLLNDLVKVSDLFDVAYGNSLELNRLEKNDNGINFVARTAKNNGITAKVKHLENISLIEGHCLTVAAGGSVLETFVQLDPFYSGFHIMVLRPKMPMNVEELFFYATCIRANQSRYSYGRQANRTLKELTIPDRKAIPVWVYGSLNRVASVISKATI